MRRPMMILAGLILTACTNPQNQSVDAVSPEIAQPVQDGVSFEDVLAEYQALNKRLEGVSYRLQSANRELCPVTQRDIGLTVHTVTDYPEDLQPIARALLSVSDGLSIRTVRALSPAGKAGLMSGDKVIAVDDKEFPVGPMSKARYEVMSATEFSAPQIVIRASRNGQNVYAELKPETICGYPVNVFFSERINGHTDGREVWITSQLMRTVADDVNLALVVAHEMAHAIAGHNMEVPTKALELEADRMALIMLSRSGYDIARAVDYWQNAPHPHDPGQRVSKTHPSMGERFNNFRRVQREIETRLARGETLTFDPA